MTPARWPYVNDFARVVWLPNHPPFDEPAVWVDSPATPRPPDAKGPPPAKAPPEAFYRFSPLILAKLAAALDRLAAKVRHDPARRADVCTSIREMIDLQQFLAERGEFTAQDLADARQAVANGTAPATPRPTAPIEEARIIDAYSLPPSPRLPWFG